LIAFGQQTPDQVLVLDYLDPPFLVRVEVKQDIFSGNGYIRL
jgi:hypothetical protein